MRRFFVILAVLVISLPSLAGGRDIIIITNARSDITDPIIAALGGAGFGGATDTTMQSIGDTLDLILLVTSRDSFAAAISTGHALETTLLDFFRKFDTDVTATILPFGHATETITTGILRTLEGDTQNKTVIDSIVVTETKAPRQERVVVDSPSTIGDTRPVPWQIRVTVDSPVRMTTDSVIVTDTKIPYQARIVVDSVVVTDTKTPYQHRVVLDSAVVTDTRFVIQNPDADTVIGFTCTEGSPRNITLNQNVEWVVITTDSDIWFKFASGADSGVGSGAFPVAAANPPLQLARRILSGSVISAIADQDTARVSVICGRR